MHLTASETELTQRRASREIARAKASENDHVEAVSALESGASRPAPIRSVKALKVGFYAYFAV
jgi:hypothetical protein